MSVLFLKNLGVWQASVGRASDRKRKNFPTEQDARDWEIAKRAMVAQSSDTMATLVARVEELEKAQVVTQMAQGVTQGATANEPTNAKMTKRDTLAAFSDEDLMKEMARRYKQNPDFASVQSINKSLDKAAVDIDAVLESDMAALWDNSPVAREFTRGLVEALERQLFALARRLQ